MKKLTLYDLDVNGALSPVESKYCVSCGHELKLINFDSGYDKTTGIAITNQYKLCDNIQCRRGCFCRRRCTFKYFGLGKNCKTCREENLLYSSY